MSELIEAVKLGNELVSKFAELIRLLLDNAVVISKQVNNPLTSDDKVLRKEMEIDIEEPIEATAVAVGIHKIYAKKVKCKKISVTSYYRSVRIMCVTEKPPPPPLAPPNAIRIAIVEIPVEKKKITLGKLAETLLSISANKKVINKVIKEIEKRTPEASKVSEVLKKTKALTTILK